MNLHVCHYSVHISGYIIYLWSYTYYAAQLQANSLLICKNNSENTAPIFQLPTHQIRTIPPWAPNSAPIPALAGFSSWHAVLTWSNLTEPDFQMAITAWVLSRQSGTQIFPLHAAIIVFNDTSKTCTVRKPSQSFQTYTSAVQIRDLSHPEIRAATDQPKPSLSW